MFERLQAVEDRYERLNELLSDPDIVSDMTKLRTYSKEQSDLQDTVDAYREYKSATTQYKNAKEMLEEPLDDEMKELVKMEIAELDDQIEALEVETETIARPERSERRQKRHHGNPWGGRRRRSGIVRGQLIQDVQPFR